MSGRNASIEAQCIVKAMIAKGYDPQDSRTKEVADWWMNWISQQAPPAEQNSGGYSSQNGRSETPGGGQPHAKPAGGGGDVHEFRVLAVEDKGNRVSLQVEVGSETKWVSAWDQAASAVRGLGYGNHFKAKMTQSKCGKYWNVKDVRVMPGSPKTSNDDIPF
jgi:hypothetical protein